MISHLVKREFIKETNTTLKKDLFSCCLLTVKILLFIAFLVLEFYVFLSLDKKIIDYSPYGSFDFLVLYNFIVTLSIGILMAFKARKSLFTKKDNQIMMVLPVKNSKLVFSKFIWLYLISAFYILLLSTPSLICFAINTKAYAYYYVFCFLFPFLISFFTVGFSFASAPIIEVAYQLIKKSDILQFILGALLMVGLCFGYQYILDLFLIALSDSQIGGMFDSAFIENLHDAVESLFPVIHILNPILNSDLYALKNIIIFLIEIATFSILGFIIANVSFKYMNQRFLANYPKKENGKAFLVTTPFRELMRKEFLILFRDKNYIFSYTSLLIMEPFLSYVVISSLNGIIYQNLELFSYYYPELINGINLVLILLFTGVINSSASLSIAREGKNLQIMKYIPISPIKQIFAKLLPPVGLALISLLVSLISLISGGIITLPVFGMGLLLGLILIIIDNVWSIEFDMRDHGQKNHGLSHFNLLFSIGYPILILFIHFLCSFTNCTNYLIYIIEICIALTLLIPCFIDIKKRYSKAFYSMEAN